MSHPISPIASVDWPDADRQAAFSAWLAPLVSLHQLQPETLRPASADASFRRYLRLDRAGGDSLIVMDAPPDKEDCAPFVKVQALLADAGLKVPDILAWDQTRGFMLLSDLGSQTLIERLDPAAPRDAEPWYREASDLLLSWQLA